MMGWYNDSIGAGGWIAMVLMMVAFWGLVIFAVAAIFRGSTGNVGENTGFEQGGRRDPMQTLDELFARGEIDADAYHARQAVLRESVH